MSLAKTLEKPLPKPQKDLVGYASARTLEALVEALLALEFLDKGYTRNAAGKAFQAWKALLAALLALEKDKLNKLLKFEEERKWLLDIGVSRVPTSKLKTLARLLTRVGYSHFSYYVDKVLNIHDYQYYGPDPDMAMSKYTSESEATQDILELLHTLIELVEDSLKPKLEELNAWKDQHSQALEQLKQRLATNSQSTD